MSHAQDQEDELSALDAIYGECFSRGDDVNGLAAFSVTIEPSLGGSEERVWVSCVLWCQFSREYPDEPPVLSLSDFVGLGDAQGAELRRLMSTVALEAAGTALVYVVAEACREWLTLRNEKPSDGSAFDEMMRRAKAKDAPVIASGTFSREDDPSIVRRTFVSAAEAEDSVTRRKRDGTPVTPESFAVWQAAFDAEMAEKQRLDEERDEAAGIIGPRKIPIGTLTGRQLFEQGKLKEDLTTIAVDEDVEEIDFTKGAASGGGGNDDEDASDEEWDGEGEEDDDDDNDEDDDDDERAGDSGASRRRQKHLFDE